MVVNYSSAKSDADKVVDEITKRGGKAVAVQGVFARIAILQLPFRTSSNWLPVMDFSLGIDAPTTEIEVL